MQEDSLRKDFAKAILWSLLALFLIPAACLWFTTHSLAEDQAKLNRAVAARMAKDPRLSAAEREEIQSFYARHPMAQLCRDDAPEAARFRAASCPAYGELWQFTWMRVLSIATLVAGVAILAWLALLGALAFVNRALQYASFVAGWRTLTFASAAMVVVQGAMCVWLSFWVTAFYTHKYYPKLIIAVGLVVLGAAILVIVKIFQRSAEGSAADGELVSDADAPRLWQRIRDMAARLGTPAPDHLIAGIDANFFVTEAPLAVGGQVLQGRKLYVSVPLLRQLDREEADAVLAHELAHLSGGDARSSAALGPKLDQFDRYLAHLYEGGASRVVLPFLRLYRMVFQLALSRESRAREFMADGTAARLVSPRAISHSLVKIAAYASYRADTEGRLFSRDERLGESLGIGHSVASGLPQWAGSEAFMEAMTEGRVPHPYDSHPPLRERMAQVGHVEPEARFAAIVTQPAAATWVDDIATAAEIESRLWAAYEQDFAAEHEHHLAWRYEPASDEERALVLKHFPAQSFALKDGRSVTIAYTGIAPPDGSAEIVWDAVKGLEYKDGSFGDTLVVKLNEKGLVGAKAVKLKLAGLKGEAKQQFKAVLGHYWQRHQHMRAYQAFNAATA
ncbi:M48 family metallopeptidase [Xenophilus sp.]|uniref:M48 family metallopeptidase n=1 Tax=Xenophilus sp. TaxID=1873499 RepID=UPI0037DCE9EE